MTDQEELQKEARRKEKHIKDEAESLARDKERRSAYMAREQAIEKVSEARHAERSEKRAVEEGEQSARDQVRRDAFLTREKTRAEGQEARKLKEKKQHPESPKEK